MTRRPLCGLAGPFVLVALALGAAPAPQTKTEAKLEAKAEGESTTAGGGTVVPSSAIPERRDYPVATEVKPCEDFYSYACKRTVESFKLRDDRSGHAFAFADPSERMLEKKKAFFAGLKDPKSVNDLSPRGRVMRTYYLGCMNDTAHAADERAYVRHTLDQLSAPKNRDELLDYLGTGIGVPSPSVVSFSTNVDQDDSDWEDTQLVPEVTSLPEKTYYEDPKLLKDYEATVEAFFRALDLENPGARAKEVVAFERTVAKVMPFPREFRQLEITRTYLPRAKFLAKYPNLRLAHIFTRIPEKVRTRELTPDALSTLNGLLGSSSLQTIRDVALYMTVAGVLDDAYPDYFSKRFAFDNKYLGGAAKRSDRTERCTREVGGSYSMELDAELLPKLFPNFPEERFVALAERVRQSIIAGLEENTWLTPGAKEGALRKMRTAHLQLVKPKNEAEWNFKPVVAFDEKTPIANRITLAAAVAEKEFRELAIPRDKTRWYMGPLTVNAYYSVNENQFVMPVGILQFPFYDPALSDEQNLGAVGTVIGHELGHGIDDNGSRFDEKGLMRGWMTEKDIIEFNKHALPLIEQFGRAGHDGRLTLGENIGDLVGLTASYRTAFPSGKGTIEDKKKFFLQYARAWCYVMRPAARARQLKTNPHALGDARVNEQVKEQPGFAEAYSCKAGDKMVLDAKDRVHIW